VQGGQTLKGTGLESIEFAVPRSLKEAVSVDRLALPPGVFLLGRAGNQQELLRSQDRIEAGQTLVFATPDHKIRELEQRLSRLGSGN
jgi:hypothetical protein